MPVTDEGLGFAPPRCPALNWRGVNQGDLRNDTMKTFPCPKQTTWRHYLFQVACHVYISCFDAVASRHPERLSPLGLEEISHTHAQPHAVATPTCPLRVAVSSPSQYMMCAIQPAELLMPFYLALVLPQPQPQPLPRPRPRPLPRPPPRPRPRPRSVSLRALFLGFGASSISRVSRFSESGRMK